MQKFNFIAELSKLFPQTRLARIVAGLHHDALIWQDLQGEFGQRALEIYYKRGSDVTPAMLALLALSYPDPLEALQHQPMRPAVAEYAQKESSIDSPLSGLNLERAGREALAVRELRRERGSWRKLTTRISSMPTTVAACLYGMIPDPDEFLLSCLDANRADIITHTLLCHSLNDESLSEILLAMLEVATSDMRVRILKQLARYRPAISTKLAGNLIVNDLQPSDLIADQSTSGAQQLSTLFYQADMRRLANMYEEAFQALEQADRELIHLQANQAKKAAQLDHYLQNRAQEIMHWQRALEQNPGDNEARGNLALTHLALGNRDEACALIGMLGEDAKALHPAAILAKIELEKERLEIRDGVFWAAEWVSPQAVGDNASVDVQCDLWKRIALKLHAAGIAGPAEIAASNALLAQPENPDLFALQASTLQAAGHVEKALFAAQLASVLDPNNPEYRMLLASIYSDLKLWQQAIGEIENAIEISTEPPLEFTYTLARAHLQNKAPEKAIQLCKMVLEGNEANAQANAILGEAYGSMDDLESAKIHFEKAAQITPDDPQPWLALASIHEGHDDLSKALDTLQEACVGYPGQAEIHLRIGEVYLKTGAPTQALKEFRQAEKLLEKNTPIEAGKAALSNRLDIKLGQALLQLGHLEDARRILERGYLCVPGNLELTKSYAETLMRLDEYELALSPLESMLERHADDIQTKIDYAQCVLHLGPEQKIEKVPAALRVTEQVLQFEKFPDLAYGLWAELLYIHQDYSQAMDAYQKAIESSLADDPTWKLRLALGLGQAALAAENHETAIAALQEAHLEFPYDARVCTQLSEAFEAAALYDNSYEIAKEALSLAADNLEILEWFAEQAQELKSRHKAGLPQAYEQACGALLHAVQLAPHRGSLYVKLAETQIRKGDADKALETLQKFIDPVTGNQDAAALEVTLQDLFRAGQCFMDIGAPANAALCWQTALSSYPNDNKPESPSHFTLLDSLTQAYRQNGDMYKALETVSEALEAYPDKAALYKAKADLLLELARDTYTDEKQRSLFLKDALASLEDGLGENPEDMDIILLIAYIDRAEGNLLGALEKAKQIYSIESNASQAMAARVLAAEILSASLHDYSARRILDWKPSGAGAIDSQLRSSFHCIRAELALKAGDISLATEHASKALEADPDHPRFLALQSRLTARRDANRAESTQESGSWDANAKEILHNGLHAAQKSGNWIGSCLDLWPFTSKQGHPIDLGTLRGLIEAALELREWAPALDLANQLSRITPYEPSSHLALARVLIQRAEFQQLCQDFDIVRRAPGVESLSETTTHEFAQAILKSEEGIQITRNDLKLRTEKEDLIQDTDPMSVIRKWQARGLAIFKPGAESETLLSELPQTVDEVIARIVCLRRTGNIAKAGAIGRSFPRHPFVLAQLAFTLKEHKPKQALAAAHAAQEILGQLYERGPEAHTPYNRSRSEDITLVNLLVGKLVIENGSRLGDPALALSAIQTALAHWPDEPRWHALAAEINLRHDGGDELSAVRAAISHLEQAIRLEPNQASYHLILGKLYLQDRNAFADQELAIKHIERACQLDPDIPEPWLLLAKAHLANGELDLAASRAERAVGLRPDDVEPLLLRAEIALLAGNPRGALSRVQSLLQIHESHPEALVLMAKALMKLGRTDEALETLERAIPVSAEPLALELERTRLILQTEGAAPAVQALEKLLEGAPNQPEILASMALAQEQAGNVDAAIFSAQRTLRNLPDPADQASQHLAFDMNYMLGRLLGQAGQLDQAVYYLSEAVRMRPGDIEPFLELGNVHRERRQYSQAIHFYKQATKLAPKDYRGYYFTGIALKESRDYLGAESMLRKASDLDPENLSIRRTLGAIVALNLVHNRRGIGQELQV